MHHQGQRENDPEARATRNRVAVAVAAILGLFLLTLFFFLLEGRSGYGGTADAGDGLGGDGDNPYAARLDRGDGTGSAMRGDGDAGTGEDGSATEQEAPPDTPEGEGEQDEPKATDGEPAKQGAEQDPKKDAGEEAAKKKAAPKPPPPEEKKKPDPLPNIDPELLAMKDMELETRKSKKKRDDIKYRSGPYKGRTAGKRGGATARKRGMTKESEAAVERGLAWLARVQNKKNGSWSRSGHSIGETSLALLAFLGAGYTHKSGKYKDTVRMGLDYLLANFQSKTGRFANSGNFYEQGIATMALCEAYGMTRDKRLKKTAQSTLDCIFTNCGPTGGFGYGGPGDDTHLTSFQVMGIKAGKLARFKTDKKVIKRIQKYYDNALNDDGTTGYSSRGAGTPDGVRTAVGLFARMFLGSKPKDRDVVKIAEVLHKVGPQINNCYQIYDGSYGMYQVGGKYWKEWNKRCRDQVIELQIRGGADDGAWPGANARGGGQVVSTAFYIMSLEVYYRFLRVNRK